MSNRFGNISHKRCNLVCHRKRRHVCRFTLFCHCNAMCRNQLCFSRTLTNLVKKHRFCQRFCAKIHCRKNTKRGPVPSRVQRLLPLKCYSNSFLIFSAMASNSSFVSSCFLSKRTSASLFIGIRWM